MRRNEDGNVLLEFMNTCNVYHNKTEINMHLYICFIQFKLKVYRQKLNHIWKERDYQKVNEIFCILRTLNMLKNTTENYILIEVKIVSE